MVRRLSGNYFEKFFISVLPWALVSGLISGIITLSLRDGLSFFLIFMTVFGLVDILLPFLEFKRPGKLLLIDKELHLGDRILKIEQIETIRPVTYNSGRWAIRMVELNLTGGEKKYIIDKPSFLITSFSKRPSKTIKLLIAACPLLKSKIRKRRLI